MAVLIPSSAGEAGNGAVGSLTYFQGSAITQTRIYAVTDGDTDERFLVRASTTAQAIAHVSKRFRVAVATQEQLVRWLEDDVEVETYKAAKQAELLP